jgi:SAM-dependent methyltransferase
VEPSAEARAFAKTHLGLNLRQETFERTCFQETFDVIVLSDVLEHMLNPATTLSEVASLLRLGGVVLLSTPNCAAAELHGADWRGFAIDPEHLFYFSEAVFRCVLPRFGLRMVHVEHRPFSVGLGGTLSGLAAASPARWLRRALYRTPALGRWAYFAVDYLRRWHNGGAIASGRSDQVLVIARSAGKAGPRTSRGDGAA